MIEIAVLKNYDEPNHRAGVQLAGSLTTYLDDIPVSVAIPPSALVVGNRVILAIPGGNLKDAVVIATWPGGTPGGGGSGSKIQDADGDTSWDVEPTADADEAVGKVKGIEAFRLHNDGILTLAKQAGARAWRSGLQSIPHNTWTKVQLNSITYDIQGEVDLPNYRIVPKRSGLYIILASVTFHPATLVADKRIGAGAKVNGSWAGASLLHTACVDTIYVLFLCPMFLAASDQVDLWAMHTFGAAADICGAQQSDWLALVKIG